MNPKATRLTIAVTMTAVLMSASVLAQDLAIKSVGSVQKKDGPMQVTVVFSEPVDATTAAVVGNYSLGAGVTINNATMMTGLPGLNDPGNGEGSLRGRVIDNQCVVLEVTGLGTAETTLTATGITAGGGAKTFTGSQAFIPSGYLWAELGRIYTAQGDPGWVSPGHREGKVIADSDNGFDIFNNGRTGWSTEDEFTFVYKPVNGDFDFKSRIEFQDFSSRWARAGIMVREFVEDGAADGCFGRYVTSHTDPPQSFTSNDAGEVAGFRAANNTYESNYRLTHYRAEYPVCGDGSRLLSAGANDTAGNGGGTPEYPQAWLRLVRAGDIITAYYSNDGTTWSDGWARDFSASGNGSLPTTMYLGPMYSAEWGNINPLNIGAQQRYFLTQHRWGPLLTPYVVRIDGNPFGFVATIKNSMTVFVPATLQLTLDGNPVTATSVVGPDASGVTTVTYTSPTILPNGAHTAVVSFKDNDVPPSNITKSSTFTLAYVTLPEDYATTTFSGALGNLWVSAHQMPDGQARGLGGNTMAATETELQDGFIDPGTGEPVVSLVDTAPEELAGVVNYTQSPVDAGYFNANNPDPAGQVADGWMPRFVAGNNYALQLYGYAQLPVGAHRMYVNSDDGFKLSFGPNALDVMASPSGAFDAAGGRGHTLNGDPAAGGFDVVVTRAGVYPFRLLYSQGTGDANVEWYMVTSTGTRVLINDTTSPVKTYPNGRGRAYVKKFLPYPGSNGVGPRPTLEIQTVDDLTSVTDSSIKVVLDGIDISSAVTKVRNGGTITVTWTPATDYPFESRHTGEFSYEEGGTTRTCPIDFTIKGFLPADLPASSFWIEVEDFDFDRGKYLPVADTAIGTDVAPYLGGGYGNLIVDGYLGAVLDVDYHRPVGPLDGANLGGYNYRTDIPGWLDPPNNTSPGYFVPLSSKLDAGVANSRPGGFTVTVNYNTGWSGSSWYNYTRTVPPGTYDVFLAACWYSSSTTEPGYPGTIDSTLDKVTAGVGTSSQTLQRLGVFSGPADGTTENLTRLKGPDGTPAVLKLNGKTTLRLSVNSGDSDYIVLAPATGVAAKVTSATPANGAKVPRNADIVTITVEDFSTTLVTTSVKLFFDGADVTGQATVAKPADITTVTYDPPGILSVGEHSYRLEFRDSASASFTNSATFTALVLGTPGQFLVEAEDFNNAGQPAPAANTMPYTGNAYNGLPAVFDTDYHSAETLAPDNSDGAGWTAVYRSGPPITSGTEAPLNDNAGDALGRIRGEGWQMTVNYKIGWTGTGDWFNYTRNVPAGNYEVYAALSHGDTAATMTATLDRVTGDVSQPDAQQVKSPLGVFSAPATGGWGLNGLVPLTATAGGPVQVITLGAPPTTLRVGTPAGDFDFLVLIPSSAPPAPTISVGSSPQGPVITFTGVLYGSSTVNGSYAPVAGATSPYTVTGGAGTAMFYRAGGQ